MSDGTLHIHGPMNWHDNAFIVGNRAGLETLRDAINAALSNEQSGTAMGESFAGDGEGFDFFVSLAADDDTKWKRPYSDECAWDQREDAVDPHSRARLDLARAGAKSTDCSSPNGERIAYETARA